MQYVRASTFSVMVTVVSEMTWELPLWSSTTRSSMI